MQPSGKKEAYDPATLPFLRNYLEPRMHASWSCFLLLSQTSDFCKPQVSRRTYPIGVIGPCQLPSVSYKQTKVWFQIGPKGESKAGLQIPVSSFFMPKRRTAQLGPHFR
jgi:hypothetical protein